MWVFVDYENVGSLSGLDIGSYDRLIVFLGPKHDELNLGRVPVSSFAKMDLLRMRKSSNNNLDFHLTFYLGLMHSEADEGVEFVVFSNDTGFDGVVEHLGDLGRKCSRLGNGNHAVKKVAKKAGKKAAKKVVSKKVAKKAVKKEAKKAAKKAAAKKVAKKNTAQLEDVGKALLAHSERHRPRSREKLTNWLGSRYPQFEDKGQMAKLFTYLRMKKVIEIDGTVVSYSDDL